MRNKLLRMIRQYDMMAPGDTVICAVSGGADSVALLFALYLLKDKLDIRLEAAHFNHHLRGEESDGDEAFVREFCGRYDIPLHVGSAEVRPGKKGLEAAARDTPFPRGSMTTMMMSRATITVEIPAVQLISFFFSSIAPRYFCLINLPLSASIFSRSI